jgi:hypothetical protein
MGFEPLLRDTNAECPNHTVPCGTAPFGWRCSRHHVPGYDRIVPPGQAVASVGCQCQQEKADCPKILAPPIFLLPSKLVNSLYSRS